MSSAVYDKSTSLLRDTTSSPESAGASGGGARGNALSNRLTSVLSASYADSEIRDALGLLDIRGVQNNAETRRRLRLDAQKEVLDCNAAVVQDFGKIAEQLQRIGSMISTLNKTCDEMRKHITVVRQESGPMLEEASSLLAQKTEVEAKQQFLTAFNKHFILSSDEINSLASSTEPVNEQFFEVLTRAKKIHEDCGVLLENENQRLGLELMDQTSRHINSAYKKLYNWVQKEFKTIDLEDPHISRSVRKALRVLAERPSLFQNCLDFFAEARESNLSHAFQAALTHTGTASSVVPDAKPIEFSTHDTLRYVGDMLAWVHSAAVSEREALEGLFIAEGDELAKGMKTGRQSEPWSNISQDDENGDNATTEGEVFDGKAALSSLVSRNLSGVARTLRQRVEYAVRGSDDAVVVYKTMNLVHFYLSIFTKLLGQDASLTQVTNDLQNFSFSHFEQLLSEEAAEASNEATVPTDLGAPQFLLNAMDRLVVLIKSNTSATFTTDASSSPMSLGRLISVALSPFLDVCSELASSLADPLPAVISTTAPDASSPVFQLNYLLPVQALLKPHFSGLETSSPLSTTLSEKVKSLISTLTEVQHAYFLYSSAVLPLLTSLPTSINLTLPELPPTFQPSTISVYAAELDAFLPSAHVDAMDNIRLLKDKIVARQSTEEAIDLFVQDFEKVVAYIEEWDQEHGAPVDDDEDDAVSVITKRDDGAREKKGIRLRDVYPRRIEEVRVLLS